MRLRALSSFVALSEPANASVENAIRLTPAAKTENLGMRFTPGQSLVLAAPTDIDAVPILKHIASTGAQLLDLGHNVSR